MINLGIALHFEDSILLNYTGTLVIVTLFSIYTIFINKVLWGVHVNLITYLIVFTAGSFTHLGVLPIILLYPLIVGLSFLYFRRRRFRLVYGIASIIGCGISTYQQQLLFNSEVDVMFLIVSVFLACNLVGILFLVSYVQAGRMFHYQMVKEKATKAIKDKNEELQQYIKSNIQLEQFAHIASHDLKAPLITIGSFAKLLKIRSKDRLSAEEQKYLSFIQENSNILIDSVNDLLEYSKVNSQHLKLSRIDTKALINDVLEVLEEQKGQKDVFIELAESLPIIIGDEQKLRRVFQNLISNAIKFSADTDHSKVSIVSHEDPQKWTFHVIDNGIGIAESTKGKIFDPFIQLNNRDQYQGSGLGLSICQKIVDQHNGDIDYQSTPGEGTTFYFTIDKNLSSN